MDTLLKFILYGIATLVLLLANVWFIQSTVHFFAKRSLPDTVAPIRIIGQVDADGRVGQVLATMLLARLDKISREMSASYDKLTTPILPTGQVQSQVVTDPAFFLLPKHLYDPMQLDMKIGGVEVGGMVNWIQRLFIKNDILQLAVENANGHAVVSGVWDDGKQTIWVELQNGPEKTPVANQTVASTMAYSLAQRQLAGRIPIVGAFDLSEFKILLDTLNQAATLQNQVERGAVAEGDFALLFAEIEKLLKKTPAWCELTQLAAVLADNGGKPEKAIDLYRSAMSLCKREGTLHAELKARVAKLDTRLAALRAVVQGTQATTASALAAWPFNAIGLESTSMARSVRIAVVGGPPAAGALNASQFEMIGGSESQQPDQSLAEYVESMVQTIQFVAPNAKFVFARSRTSSGATTLADVGAELRQLAASKPDILLITMGPLQGEIMKQLVESMVMENILVVNAAGNEAGKPVFLTNDPLLKKIATVASISIDGRPSEFTQRDESVLWAPGENIPLNPLKPQSGLRNGTSYSAAVAAGVAARVLAEHPQLKPEELISILRGTSVSRGDGQPAVINLAAALKRLSRAA